MGKEFKNIEELFQSELGGEMHAAPEFVKQNIDKSLGFQTKQRGFLILGSFALIGIIFTSILFFNQKEETTKEQLATTIIEDAPSNSNHQATITLPDNNLQLNANEAQMNALFAMNRNHHSNHLIVLPVNQQVPVTSTTDFITANSSTKSDKKTSATQTTSEKPTDIKSDKPESLEDLILNNPQYIDSNSLTEGFDATEIESENESEIENQVDDSEITMPIINIATLQVDNSMSESENTTEIESIPEAENQTTNDPTLRNETDFPEAIIAENNEENQLIDQNSDTNIPELTLNDNDSTITKENIEIDLQIPTAYKPWMLSLTSGINRVNTAYTADKITDKTIYDNAASDLLGYQTNFDFTYRLKTGLTFGSGLGISTFKEELEFKQSILETKTIKSVEFEYNYEYIYDQYFTVDSSGSIVDSITFIADSSLVAGDSSIVYAVDKNTREQITKGTNTATYFHIPVSFGTQMRFNKFQLDLFANLRFNFKLRSSGVYKKDDAVYAFNEANSIYKPFYMDVNLGSKIHYNLWQNLYLTGTVQYRPVMGVSFKNVPFNKSFDYLHFGAGISLRL